MLTQETAVFGRWKEHLEELYRKKPHADIKHDLIDSEAALDTDTVSRYESDNDFWKLETNKRAGTDQVPKECLKSVSNEYYSKLEVIIRNASDSGIIP